MMSVNTFYNSASQYYDKMIDFDLALQKRTILLSTFVNDKIKTVADVGCGTGVDSISLSQPGLDVKAFDPSKEMINNAKENSKRLNTIIDFYNYSASEIPKRFYNKFDLVVSLGNTIANINTKHLEKSFVRFYKILKDDGKILIQILNYEKTLKEKERIVNITKKNDEYFIRFYDFGKKGLTFNILKFNAEHTSKKELISTTIFPYTSKELKQLLKKSGFKKIELFSGLDRKPFEAKDSNDLVLFAKK
jgi:glycine/sarcosine N-methyltransferase